MLMSLPQPALPVVADIDGDGLDDLAVTFAADEFDRALIKVSLKFQCNPQPRRMLPAFAFFVLCRIGMMFQPVIYLMMTIMGASTRPRTAPTMAMWPMLRRM